MENEFEVQRSLGRIEGGITDLQNQLGLLRQDHAGLRANASITNVTPGGSYAYFPGSTSTAVSRFGGMEYQILSNTTSSAIATTTWTSGTQFNAILAVFKAAPAAVSGATNANSVSNNSLGTGILSILSSFSVAVGQSCFVL